MKGNYLPQQLGQKAKISFSDAEQSLGKETLSVI